MYSGFSRQILADSELPGVRVMPLDASALQVYSNGSVTVLGFGGLEILDQIDLGACRSQIVDLVKKNQAHTLAFDLTGVRLIPSGMLGLLASLKQLGLEIQLYNPSEDVLEVLEITRLNNLFTVEKLPGQAPDST